MSSETPSSAEQESAAEFAERLHGRLSSLLLAASFDGDAHRIYPTPTAPLWISDYYFSDHSNYVRHEQGPQPSDYRTALEAGTAIIGFNAVDEAAYPDLASAVVLRLCDVRERTITAMTLGGPGVDMQSQEYMVWGLGTGQIETPWDFALLRDAAAL